MESLRILSTAVDLSSHPSCGKPSVKPWVQWPAYPRYHPQTNSQTEQTNQDLKSALCCVTECHTAYWSVHLPWIEYAHNFFVSSATGIPRSREGSVCPICTG